ncbi:hypothetical protein JCGZ_09857 [Jatropha curcas]|uniref:Calcineurin-like phosphoesterase domain-containing protein n=1 Tax=Jatropha curcas TaxID=180498 RepID=A0A067JJS4_JATCU|nr:metallophosphoesterase 1 [Jatropha curcas]KDP20225.1 hypothetical protein JCGZ_09857 [Jatropha curcas]
MDLFTWNWKPVLPLLLFAFLFLYEEWVSIPSCAVVPSSSPDLHAEYDTVKEGNQVEGLKVMIVANLLLFASEAGFFNQYFRDYYMSKFFKKSFHSLKPDMLLVLGDISAKGFELNKTKWVSLLHQFHQMLGPFLELPFHVVLGDRDVGECNKLDARFVHWVSRSFPGLDSAGCGAFEISNVSFVSLNAVALLCGNNKLRFSVERTIETESIDLRMETDGITELVDDSGKLRQLPDSFRWRENAMLSGSGPVLLLHFPLYRTANDSCREDKIFEKDPRLSSHGSRTQQREFTNSGPYDLLHTVPPNATEYIFQALKPRIIFSAHTHEFCDHTHSDGTREVTVPAMTWKLRDDPGFIIATFHRDRKAVSVSYCSLARESHVLLMYISFLILFLTIYLVSNTPQLRCLR